MFNVFDHAHVKKNVLIVKRKMCQIFVYFNMLNGKGPHVCSFKVDFMSIACYIYMKGSITEGIATFVNHHIKAQDQDPGTS